MLALCVVHFLVGKHEYRMDILFLCFGTERISVGYAVVYVRIFFVKFQKQVIKFLEKCIQFLTFYAVKYGKEFVTTCSEAVTLSAEYFGKSICKAFNKLITRRMSVVIIDLLKTVKVDGSD